MPYARLLQEIRITRERKDQDDRNAMKQNAFIGWQVAASLSSKVGSFEKYVKKLGLEKSKPKMTHTEVMQAKQSAFAALDLVEQRFDGRKKP